MNRVHLSGQGILGPTRRNFIATAAAALPLFAGASGADQMPREGRKLRYAGWQVGLTYQSGRPQGLDRDYLMRLLDEMAAYRMNLLSLMMMSYGYFDPEHDGYAWPVRNPALLSYLDANCLNSHENKEFVHEIIRAAAERGIEVHFFLNWGIWNPDKIRMGYPTARVQENSGGESQGWLHCPDTGGWQAGLDEMEDLLSFYDHPNVKGFACERVGYQGRDYCYCPNTRKIFMSDTGTNMNAAGEAAVEEWKRNHVARLLAAYTKRIRRLRPEFSVGLHTQCAPGWGHDAARLQSCGIDFLLPHTIQFQETEASLHDMLHRLEPNPCVLHFCTRDKRPANYKLWIKTPEIINQAFEWVGRYPGKNLAGFLFFNETATSEVNKKAVYENLKRFEW